MLQHDRPDYKLPDPAEPNYVSGLSVNQEIARDDQPAAGAELFVAQPLFTPIWDDGWNRWFIAVLPGQPGICTVQLQVTGPPDTDITWWKKIHISAEFFGQWWQIRTLHTANEVKSSATDITQDAAPGGTLKLDFWKAGMFGIGAYLFTQHLNLSTYMGNRVVYLCNRDHYTQP